MELRDYLDILMRRKVMVIVTSLVLATLAGFTAGMRPDTYQATSSVLLRPNDAAEHLYPDRAGSRPADPNRYVAAQLDIVHSEAVALAAAKNLKLRPSAVDSLLDEVSASQQQGTDIIEIKVEDRDPEVAAKVANAFSRAYIENRREYAVTGLKRASDEIEGKLRELEGRIADLNVRIVASRVTIPAPVVVGKPAGSGTVSDTPAGAPLQAALDAATLQYETLYARQQELLVTQSLKRGEAELIAEAEAPASPVAPKPKRDFVLGALVGLVLSMGVALLREQLDERLRNREDVERVTSLPVLAELPTETESTRRPNSIATHERPLGSLAESTRGLRTSLSFLGIDDPLRLIVVTSSRPGEGKSTVATNLAAAYAQGGARTVLVSADLRRPRLETVFAEHTGGPGLSDLLVSLPTQPKALNGSVVHGPGEGVDPACAAISAALRPTHIDNLLLLPAGQLPPNPAELLGSPRALVLLQALATMADVVIMDTPPILAVTDAAVLASRADGVVVVAAAGQTHRKALGAALATLGAGRTRLLGVVLNKVSDSGRSSYYGTYGNYVADPKPTAIGRLRARFESRSGARTGS